MTQKHPLQGVTSGGWYKYQTLSAGNSFALAPDWGVPGTVRNGPQGFRDETCVLASIKLSKGCERLSPSRKFASLSTPNITLHLKDMRAVYARNIDLRSYLFFQVYLRRTEGTFSLRNPQWIPHSVKKSKEELG